MIINLLSNPRNVSTALMYSFAQRQDTVVIDEPFYAAYLAKTGKEHPGKDLIISSQTTSYDVVIREIQERELGLKNVFIKNMAHHLSGEDWSWARSSKNILFIRHPREVLKSFAKVIANPTLNDIAIQVQLEQFSYLNSIGSDVVVVDSRDLLQQPEPYLNKLCTVLGLPPDDNMTRWEPGAKPYDGVWAAYWYKQVHQSYGFLPYQEKKDAPLSSLLTGVLKDAMPLYLELYQHRLIL